MAKLFISHSSKDDAFVRDLRIALADHGQQGWVDSRELRGGDPLWPEIQKAIEEASAYAVVVSPDALQSEWVGDELAYALEVQKQRGTKQYPVIPLSLNGTKPGVLKRLFKEERIFVSVADDAGGVEAALHAIHVAIGKRDPADVAPTPQPRAEPLEELVLELTDLSSANMKASVAPQPAPGSSTSQRHRDSRRYTAFRRGVSSLPSDLSRPGS